MNYFDKNKMLSAAVILLLIINLGILGLLWYDRSQKISAPERMPKEERMHPPGVMPPPDRMQSDGGPKEFLIRELNLNEKQKTDYLRLVEEHQADMKRIKEKIRNEKDELWNNFSKSDKNTNAEELIASKIGEDQKQIELITFRHFKNVRELCDADQKEKFDEVIKEALRMMGRNNPPPGSR